MDRREFAGMTSLGILGGLVSANKLLGTRPLLASGSDAASQNRLPEQEHSDLRSLAKSLLVDWCDGMIRRQTVAPDDPSAHGALQCDSCSHIHGRCSDALYPFLHLAHATGQQKYLDAARNVYAWAENNVSREDGSWTNDINPRSWRGTTIFGAIALAEALHYHGEVLDADEKRAWEQRLDEAAGGYLFSDFRKIDFTNLNYGMTAVYGFHLFGRVLNNAKYTERSQQLAVRVKEFFTEPNKLLWGEGKPNDNRSGRGLLPVDLGYNVEESLNGVVLYALEVGDESLLDLLTQSMNGHLEFMLPDGAWDNSWGTRSAKWSYWGSRTADGCQPAFALMADRNPAFETAAIKNAELLKRCTADGLLHGGPHYVSHGVKPCIHHTFAHAKAMALVLDKTQPTATKHELKPLPRVTSDGVKHFAELDVWLAAKGPWRATVSAYDSIYKTKSADHIQQPTGGSLAVLHHAQVGTLLASSMARYIQVEPLNQQPQPGEDFPLTTRLERRNEAGWFTNLYDLKANVTSNATDDQVRFDVTTTLQDEDRQIDDEPNSQCQLSYRIERERVLITASPAQSDRQANAFALIVPIVSATSETVRRVSKNQIEIEKPEGTVVCKCNVPFAIHGGAQSSGVQSSGASSRVFNMVPGMEAVPLVVEYPGGNVSEIQFEISVS
ncbi:hypothetical protein [Rhodopirellula bahusiensis]|uniref:Uncharacterized protein n=1 Tax=Rhodopirellula bahusiensis TaxID=2014065 RepID=A0A2G1VZV3_9BACT|nr:hypothetical protein [Rhodopirellula bahusiensis]PHQ32140.1 hypothetical protein CEE69_27530 [Rhodopirellula bahusiensis]